MLKQQSNVQNALFRISINFACIFDNWQPADKIMFNKNLTGRSAPALC